MWKDVSILPQVTREIGSYGLDPLLLSLWNRTDSATMNSLETWCPGLLCLLRDTEISGVYRLGNLVTLRSQTAKPLYSFRQTGDSLHQQRHLQPGLGKHFHILSMIQWMKRIMKTKKANNITKILKTKFQLVLLPKDRPKIVSSNKELKQEHDIECPVYN